MTRDKFTSAVASAIMVAATRPGEAPEEDTERAATLLGTSLGVVAQATSNGRHRMEHYIFIRLANGQTWRLVPERVLKPEPHEQAFVAEIEDVLRRADAEDPPENKD